MEQKELEKFKTDPKTTYLFPEYERLSLEIEENKKLAESDLTLKDMAEEEIKKLEESRSSLLAQMTEILKQDDLQPLAFEKQVVAIYAALNGYFNTIPRGTVKTTGERLIDFIEKTHADTIFKPMREKRELTPEIEQFPDALVLPPKAIVRWIETGSHCFQVPK